MSTDRIVDLQVPIDVRSWTTAVGLTKTEGDDSLVLSLLAGEVVVSTYEGASLDIPEILVVSVAKESVWSPGRDERLRWYVSLQAIDIEVIKILELGAASKQERGSFMDNLLEDYLIRTVEGYQST